MIINGKSKISGIGVALPPQIVTSQSLMEEIHSESRFGVPANWMDTRVGIEERRFASEKTMPSDLAAEASMSAIENAGLTSRDISLIIFCGIERDYAEPGTAHVVQHKIGSNGACMDVSNACQGLISGIAVADAMIGTGAVDNALVCSAEVASKGIKRMIKQINVNDSSYFRDRLGCLTTGDAGSAIVLSMKNSPVTGIQTMLFDSKGEYVKYCYYRYEEDGYIDGQMLMKGICDKVEEVHQELISNCYHYLDWKPEDVSHFACHQVGKKSVTGLCKIAEVPIEKTPITYKNYGNTATCSIPIALKIVNPNPGDKILLMGGGSGLTSFQGGIVW